jgi:hypothetical protein
VAEEEDLTVFRKHMMKYLELNYPTKMYKLLNIKERYSFSFSMEEDNRNNQDQATVYTSFSPPLPGKCVNKTMTMILFSALVKSQCCSFRNQFIFLLFNSLFAFFIFQSYSFSKFLLSFYSF